MFHSHDQCNTPRQFDAEINPVGLVLNYSSDENLFLTCMPVQTNPNSIPFVRVVTNNDWSLIPENFLTCDFGHFRRLFWAIRLQGPVSTPKYL